MKEKKKKVLFIISNFNTSFYYSNKDILLEYFNVDFLQLVVKEDNSIYPHDVTVCRYLLPWKNLLYKLVNHIYSYFVISKYINKNNFDLVVIITIPSPCDSILFLYKLLSRKTKFYLNLCTPLGENSLYIFLYKYNLKLFKYVAGDTPLLRNKLGLNNRKYLFRGGVGYSDRYNYIDRNFDDLHLVYIGTLERRVDKTIDGFYKFVNKYPNINCTYDIIGGGKPSTLKLLEEHIESDKNHCNKIKMHGFLPKNDVVKIFNSCNIGVSFVPKIEMYDGVSVTKTVEYFLCGMPVIGTSVSFNSNLIKDFSGILCDDSSDSFAEALEKVFVNRKNYSSKSIRKKYEYMLSDNVIRNSYIPDMMKIIDL